ncbi:MAG TPA: ribbon-helix-helix domain-containing protein [Candidatus Saccharimonadia bacterium]
MKKQITPEGTASASPGSEPKSVRFNVSMQVELLNRLDDAARQEYTTRSDLIRTAVLWYLRPQGPELDRTDPDLIVKTLQQRKLRAGVKKMLKDAE